MEKDFEQQDLSKYPFARQYLKDWACERNRVNKANKDMNRLRKRLAKRYSLISSDRRTVQ